MTEHMTHLPCVQLDDSSWDCSGRDYEMGNLKDRLAALEARLKRYEAFVARADEYRAWAGDCLDTLCNDLYDAARAAIDAQERE